MKPGLVRDIEEILQKPDTRDTLKAKGPLTVAASTLSAATVYEMTATTVVGVLGRDDEDAFRSLVKDICDEYDLEARVKIQGGSYSVRFSRRSLDAARR